MKERWGLIFSGLLFVACATVGALAALGRFNSMIGFPLVFGGVCFVLGAVSLWRDAGPRAPRAALMLAGVAAAVGGWFYQMHEIDKYLRETQQEVWAFVGGQPAPRLVSLDALRTRPEALEDAASFSSAATIVTFWATWCSPCWAEMAELQELYEQHRSNGLMVLALTQYDDPDTEEGRRENRAGAESFLEKRGFEYPAAITSDGANYKAYEVRSIPSTALIDETGTIVGYAVGLDGARALMAKAEAMVTGGPRARL
ncbi:MAG: TlpA family protein disulfide reductase [Thermoanaerobaculia bacterium]